MYFFGFDVAASYWSTSASNHRLSPSQKMVTRRPTSDAPCGGGLPDATVFCSGDAFSSSPFAAALRLSILTASARSIVAPRASYSASAAAAARSAASCASACSTAAASSSTTPPFSTAARASATAATKGF